jgi:hypothetical protein
LSHSQISFLEELIRTRFGTGEIYKKRGLCVKKKKSEEKITRYGVLSRPPVTGKRAFGVGLGRPRRGLHPPNPIRGVFDPTCKHQKFPLLDGPIACHIRALIFQRINCRFDSQMITLKKIHRRR